MKYLKRFNESVEVMDFDKMYKTTAEKVYNEVSKEFKGRFFPLRVVLDELDNNYNMSICLALGWMNRLSEQEEDWLEELVATTVEIFELSWPMVTFAASIASWIAELPALGSTSGAT